MTGFPYVLADVKAPLVRALRLTNGTDITLAVSRINVHHKELCALSDWAPLRKYGVQTPSGGKINLDAGAGVVSVSAALNGMPYWFAEHRDLHSGDLRGVRLWTLEAPSVANKLTIETWKWDSESGKHTADNSDVDVSWWSFPAALSNDTDKIALPSTRALLAACVCDLIGLMDRKEPDAMPWRKERASAMAELMGRIPVTMPRVYKTLSGRVLMQAPVINYNTQAVATEQRDEENN